MLTLTTLFFLAACTSTATNKYKRVQPKPITLVKTKDGAELVCKFIRPVGSRIKRSVCFTQLEWDDITRQTQKELRRIQDFGTIQ